MPSPTVSIIIPAYNAEAFLVECLDSVLAQTYNDWEAIVVDDGSTDATPRIIREYADRDSRFRVITDSNRGVSAARNSALTQVRGTWITYLDSDDKLYPQALEILTAHATDSVDIVYGRWSHRRHGSCVPVSSCRAATVPASDVLVKGLYQIDDIDNSPCAKLFRYEAIRDIRFVNDMRYEDIVYFVDVFSSVTNVVLLDSVVYCYRPNPKSFINTFHPGRLDALKATEMIERRYLLSQNDTIADHRGLIADQHELAKSLHDRRLSANFNIFGLLAVHDRDGRYRDVADSCWFIIRAYRLGSLLNPRVRLKNKLGILVSYLGRTPLTLISRIFYR